MTTCARLAERGVPSVLLKGAGLARRLGTEGHRVYADVDLLVAPDTFDLAERSLAASGFRSRLPAGRPDHRLLWYERPWRAPGPVDIVVDLHRGFHGVANPEELWTLVFGSAERIALAGGEVLVPDAAAAALLVALHAAAPGRSHRPYADLLRALEVLPPQVWQAAAGLADRTGAAPLFGFGLRLTPDGAKLANDIGLPDRSTPLQWIRVRRVAGPAHVLAQLAELPTHRGRLRHLWPYLFPPRGVMRHTDPLARYGPAGLLAAYLLRIVRHVRRLPQAVTELRTVALLARRSNRD
ncbi:nucleotidyltransferase family protein [Micromonospora sp. NPDC002389]|uniref:nucleotidyltransferase family protein n=1 Tax=Micromonospora sp. NPDC002389 TaxID=3154272 RepID=UPI0033301677